MDELIAALIRALKQAGVTAVKAYPEGVMPKLEGAVTAVGLRAMKNAEQGWSYLGMRKKADGSSAAFYGRSVEAEAEMRVYCPRRIGGRVCMAEAEKAAAVLAAPIGGIRIEAFSVGACAYEPKSDCFCCTLTAKTQAYVYAAANEDETEFTDFILKGEVK